MIFSTVYRASFYLMLLFATLSLDVDVSESKIAWIFPPGVGVAGLLAFLTVDRNPKLGLSRSMAYGVLVIALALTMMEYRAEGNLLLALAHFLVYLQVIKILLPKNVEDDWLLFGLGVMQVLVGAVISQSDREGTMLFCWALMAIWVLGLFYLHRESLRAELRTGTVFNSEGTRVDPYPGLINSSFVFSALRVMVTTLALGGIIFLLMPRRSADLRAQGIESSAKHLTGFDDEIKLGQLGEILESDSVVMTVEFKDLRGDRVAPASDSLLWRGVTLDHYGEGRWHRRDRPREATFPDLDLPDNALRQIIKLEPTDSDVLFGLRPIYGASAVWRRANPPDFNHRDGTLYRNEVGRGTFDYTVLSGMDPDVPQAYEIMPGPKSVQNLLEIPDPLAPRLKEITRKVLARESLAPEDTRRRAKALEYYLRDSGEFGYTLSLKVDDPNMDPVLDFLINRKEGHCEYFASSLTLLLRAEKIPARMVNGFKGGDWSSLSQILSVRQKHAHSWVEALVAGENPGEKRWITLDPTPAKARAASVAQVGGIRGNLRQLTDLVRYIWVFYIVGFNADRQKTLLYQPITELIEEARKGFSVMGDWLRIALADLLTFKDVGQFFSPRGFIVSFTGLLLLLLGYQLARWALRRLIRWFRGPASDDSATPAGLVFYRRLATLLAECGLERPPAETQHEFARRATVFLTGRGAGTAVVAEVPSLVVDAFYRVRFGHRELDPGILAHLEQSLDALEACLHEEQT